jgi:hypothetical protein
MFSEMFLEADWAAAAASGAAWICVELPLSPQPADNEGTARAVARRALLTTVARVRIKNVLLSVCAAARSGTCSDGTRAALCGRRVPTPNPVQREFPTTYDPVAGPSQSTEIPMPEQSGLASTNGCRREVWEVTRTPPGTTGHVTIHP